MTGPVHANAWGAAGAILEARGGWHWAEPRDPEHFRRCDYCGCINPEDLATETGWRAEWADMKYGWPHKFYVDIPDKLGKLDWLGGSTGDMTDEELARYGWKRITDLTSDERAALGRYAEEYAVVGVGVRERHHAKFYTEHLQDPDIADEIKDEIQRVSGLTFEWLDDGRVRWRHYEDPSA